MVISAICTRTEQITTNCSVLALSQYQVSSIAVHQPAWSLQPSQSRPRCWWHQNRTCPRPWETRLLLEHTMSTEPRQQVTIASFTRPSSPVAPPRGKQVDYKSQVKHELWHENHIETVTDVALYFDFYHLQSAAAASSSCCCCCCCCCYYYYYYYYIHLTAFFPGQPATRKVNHFEFYWSNRWWGGISDYITQNCTLPTGQTGSPNLTDLKGINNTDWMIVFQRLHAFVEQVVQSVLQYKVTTTAYKPTSISNNQTC